MKTPLITAALLLASWAALRAGDVPAPDVSATPADASASATPGDLHVSYEFDGDASCVGDSRTNFGSGSKGDVSEAETSERLVVSPQYNDGPIYRFGLGYQHYSFGLSKAAPIPDTLQSENIVAGMDFQLFNSWLVRVEADPGFYSDGRHFGYRDFNVPFTIGGSYIAGEELQYVLGIEVDFDRQIPVYPGVGLRWAINDDWVLDAILPTPRLEYDWSKALTLYLGSDVEDDTYRVDKNLGAAVGRSNLSNAIVEYDEVRVGAGFSWKASKVITLELEGGYLPYREFDFHRADAHFSNDNGAPYGQMSINAQF